MRRPGASWLLAFARVCEADAVDFSVGGRDWRYLDPNHALGHGDAEDVRVARAAHLREVAKRATADARGRR